MLMEAEENGAVRVAAPCARGSLAGVLAKVVTAILVLDRRWRFGLQKCHGRAMCLGKGG